MGYNKKTYLIKKSEKNFKLLIFKKLQTRQKWSKTAGTAKKRHIQKPCQNEKKRPYAKIVPNF